MMPAITVPPDVILGFQMSFVEFFYCFDALHYCFYYVIYFVVE